MCSHVAGHQKNHWKSLEGRVVLLLFPWATLGPVNGEYMNLSLDHPTNHPSKPAN